MSTRTESTETKVAVPAPAKKLVKKAAKKATTPKKTAKSKPAKKAGAKRGGPRLATKFAGKKIKVLVKENPKREGTRSYKAFTAYKNGMPVEKLLAEGKKVGFKSSDLAWDIAHKFVALH